MKIRNKAEHPWYYEFFFNYFDGAGLPKAQTSRLNKFDTEKFKGEFVFDVGWGNSQPGSWKDDKYTLEVVFMDTLVGAVTFECGDEEEEGEPELLLSHDKAITSGKINRKPSSFQHEDNQDASMDQLLDEMNQLIGLEQVKQKIRETISYLNFAR